jgi:hypothetical protein
LKDQRSPYEFISKNIKCFDQFLKPEIEYLYKNEYASNLIDSNSVYALAFCTTLIGLMSFQGILVTAFCCHGCVVCTKDP